MSSCVLYFEGPCRLNLRTSYRRRLTLVTIIGLPMTLLTGYFVRFGLLLCSWPCLFDTPGHELRNNVVCSGKFGCPVSSLCSTSLFISSFIICTRFWKIAVPVVTVTAIWALWSDLVDLHHYMMKKLLARRAVQMVRSTFVAEPQAESLLAENQRRLRNIPLPISFFFFWQAELFATGYESFINIMSFNHRPSLSLFFLGNICHSFTVSHMHICSHSVLHRQQFQTMAR